MSLSIRNRLVGTVTDVTAGEAMTTVKVRLEGGQDIVAAITSDAARELGLAAGSAVRALVKATEVALAAEAVDNISIRNQLAGTVAGISLGAAMATVTVVVNDSVLTAAVTKDAVEALDLAAGSPVVALIKATEVALAVG
ncbi:TOBE domain-containing protein [Streptomyces sp. NPDC007369]|uniref:TOBE domain-containing protein n=1 Tax=Streptomyces sp. NPDC007369 TaxID=3154589 RepID=UPI0034046035